MYGLKKMKLDYDNILSAIGFKARDGVSLVYVSRLLHS